MRISFAASFATVIFFLVCTLVDSNTEKDTKKDGSWGSKDGNTKDSGSKDTGTGDGTDDGSGWECRDDGYWYQNGEKTAMTEYCGDGKSKTGGGDKNGGGDKEANQELKSSGCTVTEMTSSAATAAVQGMERTCVQHESHSEGRCWWTHVPADVYAKANATKVPLVVDMHGGGGCAWHQSESSGYKELADSEGFIVAFPQGGPNGQWASHGTSWMTQREEEKTGKVLPKWDDIGFLHKLVDNMISSPKYRIDPERIYMTGFSLGGMMANRFAMENSSVVAAFSSHGSALSFAPSNQAEMDQEMSRYNIQPMPAYLGIGVNDEWRPGCNISWYAWKYWNGCVSTSTDSSTEFDKHTASDCKAYEPALHTVMLDILDYGHAPHKGSAEMAWKFMKQYRRVRTITCRDIRKAFKANQCCKQPDKPFTMLSGKRRLASSGTHDLVERIQEALHEATVSAGPEEASRMAKRLQDVVDKFL